MQTYLGYMHVKLPTPTYLLYLPNNTLTYRFPGINLFARMYASHTQD